MGGKILIRYCFSLNKTNLLRERNLYMAIFMRKNASKCSRRALQLCSTIIIRRVILTVTIEVF